MTTEKRRAKTDSGFYDSPKPPSATGSDVARLAGVSKSAVSRVFAGGSVSERTREKVLAATAQLKYRPNHSARTLTTRRSYLVGVAMTHLDNQFYPHVLELISDALAKIKYRAVLFLTHGEQDQDPVLDEIISYGVDALILASSSLSVSVALECEQVGIPTIMFNNVDPEGRVQGISTENIHAGYTIARFLAAAGHSNFGVISGVSESSTSLERTHGFNQGLIRSGKEMAAIEAGLYDFEQASYATEQLLNRKPAIDALFCVNDHMALAALQTAQSLGIQVGEELSIVGFDNVAISGWPAFQLTTYEQPAHAMVKAAIGYLTARINGSRMPISSSFRGRLIVRGSSRKPADLEIDDDGTTTWRVPSGVDQPM